MPTSSTTRRNHVVDDALVKAAKLFDELGYSNTSLQDIADAVGIARPSLYHYFKSKEEILATLVDRSTQNRQDIVSQVRKMDGPPRARLSELLRQLGRATSANPAGLRLTLNNSGALPPDVRRRSTRSRRVLFELIVEILAEGVDAGVLRPMDEREVAATIIAAVTGLQYRDIGGVGLEPEQSADLLEQMLVFGISQPPDRQASTLDDAVELLRRDLDTLQRLALRNREATVSSEVD